MADCPEREGELKAYVSELKHGLKISNDATHPYLVFVRAYSEYARCRRSVMNPDAEEVFAQFYFRRKLAADKTLEKARPILPLSLKGGGQYTGPTKNGKPDGMGVMFLPDGRKYEGFFRSGRFDGQGLLHFPDGRKYEGEFKAGSFHGKGNLDFGNGTLFEGN